MALQQKTFSSPTTSNGYTLMLVLKENGIDSVKNDSSVDYSLVLKSGNASFAQYKIGWSVALDGSVVSSKAKADASQRALEKNSSITIVSGTKKITHNSDGKKTISVAFSIDMDKKYYTLGAISVSGQSMTLTVIPRATTPEIPNSIEMGGKITVNLPRTSNAFTHDLSYTFGTASGVIGKSYGSSAQWSVPISLAEQVPNAKSGSGTITCKTYSGTSLVGTVSVPFTAAVPNTIVPTVSKIEVSETVTEIFEHFSGFVQGRSKIRVKTTALGAYKSKITSIKVSFDGQEYTGADIVTASPAHSGALSVNVTVTDSRGRTAKQSQSIAVIPYLPPTVNSFSANRADTSGLEDDEGEYMAYAANYSISSVNNLNNAVFQIQYKSANETEWQILLTETEYTKVFSGVSTEKILNPDTPYNIRLLIKDFFNTVYVSVKDIPTAFTIADFDESGQGIAFGGVCRGKGMHIYLPVTFYDKPLLYKNTNTYKMLFLPGDTVTFGNLDFIASALVSGDSKNLYVQIPISKPICAKNVTGEGTVIARGVNGYLNGTNYDNSDIQLSGGSGYSVSYKITDMGIRIIFAFNDKIPNVTNNTPVSVTAKGSITFVFS